MPLIDPALRELAGLYQISTEFWDWKGRHTEVDDASVIAVLAAFEVDASTPEKAREAVGTHRTRAWQRALPPCVVLEQGVPTTFPVHVQAGAGAHVFIRLEDGGTVDARQVENPNPDREVDGEWIGEATFAVPEEVPLGYHRIVLRSLDREVESALIVTPSWLGFPRQMGDKRIWGFATQLYSVASHDSWGVGDLTDLADMAVRADQPAARRGACRADGAVPVPAIEPTVRQPAVHPARGDPGVRLVVARRARRRPRDPTGAGGRACRLRTCRARRLMGRQAGSARAGFPRRPQGRPADGVRGLPAP
jgi:4-alpha-glucanotransferase